LEFFEGFDPCAPEDPPELFAKPAAAKAKPMRIKKLIFKSFFIDPPSDVRTSNKKQSAMIHADER
jgi:hypothetical protein